MIPVHITDIRGARAHLRSQLDIVQVIADDIGSAPKVSGQDSFWCCPFHMEKSPSMAAHSEMQFFKCFGCSVGGDVVAWAGNYNSLSTPDAILHLSTKYQINIDSFTRPPTQEELQTARYKTIYEAVARICNMALMKNTQLRDWYINDTGFDNETIVDYRIGWSESVGSLVNSVSQIVKDVSQEEVTTLELDHGLMWSNALVYPITNISGHYVGFHNRPLSPPANFGGKYVGNSNRNPLIKERLVFGLEPAKKHIKAGGFKLRVLEGQKAAMAARGVAVLGSTIQSQQVELFKEIGVRELQIAFDGDEAGRKASMKILDVIEMFNGINTFIVEMPDNMQADGVMRKYGREALDFLFMRPKLPIQHFFEMRSKGGLDEVEKQRVLSEAHTFLLRLNEVQLEFAAAYLGEKLGISASSIITQIQESKAAVSNLNNRDAEHTLLKSVLLDFTKWAKVKQIINKPDPFTSTSNQGIFTAINNCAMRVQGSGGLEVLTVQNVRDELKTTNMKNTDMLIDEILSKDSKYNFDYAVETVAELHRRRLGVSQAKLFGSVLYDLNRPLTESVSKFRRELISGLTTKLNDNYTPPSLADAVNREIQIRMTNRGKVIGHDFSTITDVDGVKIPALTTTCLALSGLQKGHQTVVSAQSGVGKSLLSLQMAVSLAICPDPQDQIPILWIPLEMNQIEISFRIISLLSGIDNNMVQHGRFNAHELGRYKKSLDMIAAGQLYFQKPQSGTIDEVVSIVDEYKFKYGIEIVVLDYIGLLAPSDIDRGTSKTEYISRASRVLKNVIAEDMSITSLTIAQQNRSEYKAGDVGNQQGIGSAYQIVQDADDVLILSEKNQMQMEEEKGLNGNRRIFIDKRRGGPGDILINWDLDDTILPASKKTRCLRCIEVVNNNQILALGQ